LSALALAAGLVLIAPATPALAAPAPAIVRTINLCNASASEPTLRLGSRGYEVGVLQCALNGVEASLFPPGGLNRDGVFGSVTLQWVLRFQACAHIDQDGVVGPITWNNLLARLANHNICT
jgi:zinc D-Ala-D-Ala carboxypeptidase